MKKFFILALSLISSMSAFSNDFLETVYLRNGSIIKGDIVEFQPHKLIKVESADGNYFVVDYKDIEKITRERISHDFQTNEYVDGYTEHVDAPQFSLTPGYRGFVGVETMLGNFIGLELSTVHGKQLNNKIFIGGGTGIIFADNWEGEHYSFPVFADFRVDFVNKKISPFLDLRAGADFAVSGDSGFYGDCSVGCRFKRSSISFGLHTIKDHDYIYQSERYYYVNPDTGLEDVRYYGGEYRNENQVLNFVARFSFEF